MTAQRPRLITTSQLRAYLGCDGRAMRKLRERGLLPEPLPGTRRYDFKAVERALDRRTAPAAESSSAEAEERLIEKARTWGKSR